MTVFFYSLRIKWKEIIIVYDFVELSYKEIYSFLLRQFIFERYGDWLSKRIRIKFNPKIIRSGMCSKETLRYDY